MKKSLLLFTVFITFLFSSRAQVVVTQNFDALPFNYSFPLGWSQGKIGLGTDSSNVWRRWFFGGDYSAMYQSSLIQAGDSAFIATPRLDMRNGMPAGGAVFNFWLQRFVAGTYFDRIRVYVNDSAVFSGGALLLNENITGASTIHVSSSQTPVSSVGWNNYFYTIPNVSPYNGGSVYIIVVGISDHGMHTYIDDFSINTYPMTQSYVAGSAGVFHQSVASTSAGFTEQIVIGCKLTMSGTVTPRLLTDMEFNTFGSTNPVSDITRARLWFSGGTPSLNMENAVLLGTYNNPWLTNFTFLTPPNANYTGMIAFTGLVHGDNYFWLTYDIAPGAVMGDFVDAEWINFMLNWVSPPVPSPMTLAGNRLIDISYCEPLYLFGVCSMGQSSLSSHISSVVLPGDNIPPPGINNNLNYVPYCSAPFWSANFLALCPPPYPRYCPFQCSPPNYELFAEVPGKTTCLTADGVTPYTIQIQSGSYPSGNTSGAWIDFNHDGDFYDAGEKIAQSGLMPGNGIYFATFTVPATATPGKTRLRVRDCWQYPNNMDPCAMVSFGEAEDYVVTIVPDCPSVPGWTTWIGITDDWASPGNWCPPIVPMVGNPNMNVRFPGGPSSPGYVYHSPVIKSGIQARAVKLRIENNDTLFVNAISGSTLNIMDSLRIETSAGAMIVNSRSSDSAQVHNGMLSRPSDSPLSSSQRARSFIAFTQVELLAKGMLAGDTITSIRLHLQRNSNGNPYKNFTLKYFYTTNAQALFGVGPAANIPLPTGTPASPVTLWSGDLDPDAYIPVIGNSGTIVLTLSTPLVWNGGANPLIIEMCYDNTGFPLTSTNDEIRFTQTTSLRRYMTIESLSGYVKAGCALTPKDTLISPSVGTAGSNQLTVAAVDAADILPGQVTSLGSQVISVAGNVVTLSINLTSSVNGNVTFYNALTTSIVYRPNLTFEYSRPYTKFPISVAGHWENNGTFDAGVSRVTFNGSVPNQKISGASQTTFYDLAINNPNHVLRTTDFTVSDSLQLTSGRLKLNNGMVTLTKPSPGALTRTAGYIQSETDATSGNMYPFGRIHWTMGSSAGLRQIPFINSTGTYIPFDYTIVSGTHNAVIGTYGTLANNTNLPLPEVSNVFGYTGTVWSSNGDAVADRFFLVKDSLGVSPVANLVFRYANSERSVSNPFGVGQMNAQRWMTGTAAWEFPFVGGQSYVTGNPDQVVVNNFSGFNANNWWAMVGHSTPLPVTLLDFRAERAENKVRLNWVVESEANASHYIVEKTVDHKDFANIARVESKGPSTGILDYEAWDEYPVEGIQYYYLHRHDHNGLIEKYGPVWVNFRSGIFEILTAVISQTNQGITLLFEYNSNEPINYKVMDMSGRVIVARDKQPAVPGQNALNIELSHAEGLYQVVLQNSEKVVTRRFFY